MYSQSANRVTHDIGISFPSLKEKIRLVFEFADQAEQALCFYIRHCRDPAIFALESNAHRCEIRPRGRRRSAKHAHTRGLKSAKAQGSKAGENRAPFCERSFYRCALYRSIMLGLPGCAYINNNCRANNKAGGTTLDSPKLLVPLPEPATFYCLRSREQEWRQSPSSFSMAVDSIYHQPAFRYSR